MSYFRERVVQPTHVKEGKVWVPNPQAEPDNDYWNPKPLKTKAKHIPFKPSSAKQVVWNLNKKYGWLPSKFTDKGNVQFDEEVIASLDFPETKELVHYAQVCSRIAELVGNSGYLTLLGDDGRLHGNVMHCGAVTHRCTHQRPNMGNVTGVTNTKGVPQLYGREMRELFGVPDDSYVIVGADASGLELRMLGNRMAQFDGGKYAAEVVDGDAHTVNAQAQRLDQYHKIRPNETEAAYRSRVRTASKPVTYAHNYGAFDEKLGDTARPDGETWSVDKTKRVGRDIRRSLLAGLPALKQLIDSLKEGWVKGKTIEGLDGRVAEVRAQYRALNTQLQMDGAIVVKWATVRVHRVATERWGPPSATGVWCMVGHVHDEYQFQVKRDIADDFGLLLCEAFGWAGQALGVVPRLEGEYKVGTSWAETH